jgi:hypothetical protein
MKFSTNDTQHNLKSIQCNYAVYDLEKDLKIIGSIFC